MLLRTKAALEECKAHLACTNSWNSSVESYLTQHILVILCAEIQQSIYLILELRLAGAEDAELKNFAITTGKKCLRSVGKAEISGFLGFFSTSAKNYLNDNIDDVTVSLYNNAIASRHDVAHSVGTKITFSELEKVLDASILFLTVVNDAVFASVVKAKADNKAPEAVLDFLHPPVPR
jgi:hypothetical protein